MNIGLDQFRGAFRGAFVAMPFVGFGAAVTGCAYKISQYADRFFSLPVVKGFLENTFAEIGGTSSYDVYALPVVLGLITTGYLVTNVVRGFLNPDREVPNWLMLSMHSV